MAVDPNSFLDVFDNIQEFLAPPKTAISDFQLGTNVKARGNFTNESWESLVGELLNCWWASSHHVVLYEADTLVMATMQDLTKEFWRQIANSKGVPEV